MAHNQEKYLFKIKKEIQYVWCVILCLLLMIFLLSIQFLVLIKYNFHFLHSFIQSRERVSAVCLCQGMQR